MSCDMYLHMVRLMPDLGCTYSTFDVWLMNSNLPTRGNNRGTHSITSTTPLCTPWRPKLGTLQLRRTRTDHVFDESCHFFRYIDKGHDPQNQGDHGGSVRSVQPVFWWDMK